VLHLLIQIKNKEVNMKFTTLSLVATLALSSAYAGGDITPIEAPVAVAPAESATTIAGKLTAYYITDDSTDDFFGDQGQLAAGATLDVSHKFSSWLTANASVLGYVNALNDTDSTWGFFEKERDGAFFNTANLTGTFGDTTVVAGRQLLATPMVQGYDWLLAPASFEAYTVVNNSIENVTLVGAYITKLRGNNSGDFQNNLEGENWTIGAAYDDKTISASVWYYNVDAADYTQIYADAGYNFTSFKVEGQYVGTDFGVATDATAFGLKASTSLLGFDLSAAYNNLADNVTGYVSWNGLYTNQWNATVADQFIGSKGDSINAFKVAASTTISDISTEVSYASFDNDFYEANVILGYEFTESIDGGIVYSNTQSAIWIPNTDVNQLEIYANYKF
jgi:hypothetical protein